MQTCDVDYRCDEVNLRGYLAVSQMLPAVMRAALYNERADGRSWASMKDPFDEVLT